MQLTSQTVTDQSLKKANKILNNLFLGATALVALLSIVNIYLYFRSHSDQAIYSGILVVVALVLYFSVISDIFNFRSKGYSRIFKLSLVTLLISVLVPRNAALGSAILVAMALTLFLSFALNKRLFPGLSIFGVKDSAKI